MFLVWSWKYNPAANFLQFPSNLIDAICDVQACLLALENKLIHLVLVCLQRHFKCWGRPARVIMIELLSSHFISYK